MLSYSPSLSSYSSRLSWNRSLPYFSFIDTFPDSCTYINLDFCLFAPGYLLPLSPGPLPFPILFIPSFPDVK